MKHVRLKATIALLLLSGITNAQQVASQIQQTASTRKQGASLDSRISVDIKGVTLKAALIEIASQLGTEAVFSNDVLSVRKLVTVKMNNSSARRVLDEALRGSGIVYRVYPTGELAFAAGSAQKSGSYNGVIVGKVTDAKSGRAVPGATVSISSDNRGVATGDDGSYRLTGVSSGVQTVSVRLVGYAKQTRSITVGEGATVTADFRLEPSANVLDQVVVTGTVAQTELKAVPNAITVITAKQIEERGITHIDQLFRGDIPGLFAQNQGSSALLDEVTMFSRGVTALSQLSSGVSEEFLTNPIKTYVDGVEMADPKYLSQLDPKSIERIEILTGPQASTIYGSNALNGVMQVFTKRGSTSRPQVNLALLSGWVANNFRSTLTPQHDYSGQLNGVEGKLSYNLGGSWNYIGPWTPAKQTTRTSGFGGARFELPVKAGRIHGDITMRRTNTRNIQRGNAQQAEAGYREDGWWLTSSGSGVSTPATSTLNGQTFGAVVGYSPASWWSHEFGFGTDAATSEQLYTAKGFRTRDDTTLLFQQAYTGRSSLRYTMTSRLPVTSWAQATVTAGADSWKNLTSSIAAQPQALTGTLANVTSVTRRPDHNTGAYTQLQLALQDKLFFTYGLRAEWNPAYGEDAQVVPGRYGVAYTQDVGPVTAKLRGSYGRSTRPPIPSLTVAIPATVSFGNLYTADYGNFDLQQANPELGPEFQQGGEGGVELYFANRGSLVVTRYNQTIDDLIARPKSDSVRSINTCASPCFGQSFDTNGYGYFWQFQYMNVASIRNQGWELQGTMNLGPLTANGTYSWTQSRTIGANPKYRSFFTPTGWPQYQPGATFKYLPEHTWAFGTAYTRNATSVRLNVTGVGLVRVLRDEFSDQYLASTIRLPANRLSATSRPYSAANQPYATASLTASQRLRQNTEGVLQIHNLTDHYTNDFNGAYATMGRQIMIGLRLR